MTQNNDNFIMLPTVDFCFKELMQNPKVRQGFIAALLKVKPEMIRETTLLPTILSRDSETDKLGILDVRVRLENGTQLDMEMQVAYVGFWEQRSMFYLTKMYSDQIKKGESYDTLKKCIQVSILNFNLFQDEDCYRKISFWDHKRNQPYSDLLEIQILELQKLPGELPENDSVLEWMRFFSGKTRKEFEEMAKTDEYFDEAYDTLLHLSADEAKRLEYEAREKALKDYNSQVKWYFERGKGEGREEGIQFCIKIFELQKQGKTDEEIAKECQVSVDLVREILLKI